MAVLLAAFSVFCFSAMANSNNASPIPEAVTVRCLTKNKKAIPLYWQCGQLWTTNVKLPDLVVINRGADPITPCELEIAGMSGGKEVAVNRIAVDLGDFVKQVNDQFKKMLGSGVLEEVYDPRLASGFGAMEFGGTKLCATDTVNPGESAVILLSHGLLLYADGMGRLRTVEGDERFHEALFGAQADPGKGRAVVFHGANEDEAYRGFLTEQLRSARELSAATRHMLALDGVEDGVFVTPCAPNELLWLNATDKEMRRGRKRLPAHAIMLQSVRASTRAR